MMQPVQFPEPVEIDPRRQRTSYRIFGNEFFSGPVAAFGEQIIVEVLRVVLKLRNLRRAEGQLGTMAGFRTRVHDTELNVYLTPDGSTSCWPGPLHLVVSTSLLFNRPNIHKTISMMN
jgi:linoleate 10R-lipoxygenase